MLIFFKQETATQFLPIVLVDYTRSDEQYTYENILSKISKAALGLKNVSSLNQEPEIFSLSYRVVYKHSGINAADSLKTSCSIEIENAPSALTNLVNVKQFMSQENALALESTIKAIIDPQVIFPQCVLIIKNETNLNTDNDIVRSFMIYSTNFSYDGRRIISTLTLSGAAFSSMVIQLKTAVDIKKDKPLVSQLAKALESTKYAFKADPSIQSVNAKVERYYPPSTMNNILSDAAKDNGIFIDIDDDTQTVNIKSLNPNDKPKSLSNKTFCFRGKVPGAKLIANFSVQDFSKGIFETEIEDVKIFDSIIVYDDSDADLLFENFIEYPGSFTTNFKKFNPETKQLETPSIKAYQFYVQEYSYLDDRTQTKLKMIATNNWVVSNFKLNAFLENAIYKGQF